MAYSTICFQEVAVSAGLTAKEISGKSGMTKKSETDASGSIVEVE